MVGIVVVSHSKKVAEGAVELALHMAPTAKILPAGGMDDGKFGTSQNKIRSALENVCSEDGAVVIVDLGSSVLEAERAIEGFENKVVLLDCPLVEGTMVAAVESEIGSGLKRIMQETKKIKIMPKW